MDSQTYGIFGPGGLLAKMEAEEKEGDHNHVHESSIEEAPAISVDQSLEQDPGERSIGKKRPHEDEDEQETCAPKTLKKVPENNATVSQGASDEKLALVTEQQQQFLETSEQLKNNDAQDLSPTLKANLATPISQLPPLEAAKTIEKIWKTIFSHLEPKDLLRCRLVSSSWLRLATNDKLRQCKASIIEIKNVPQTLSSFQMTRRLKELTDFLDGMGSHPFLCSSLRIVDMTINNPQNDLFKFFDRYGFLVKYLNLKFVDGHVSYSMNSLLEFVTRLLSEQMPNLETLILKFGHDAKFAGEIDPQLLIKIKEGSYLTGKQNQNLRTIKFDFRTPFGIIDAVRCLAPKVERLVVEDFGFWLSRKHDLHLLTELKLIPSPNNRSNLEAVIKTEEKLFLRKLKMKFLCDYYIQKKGPFIVDLLKMILEKSSHCLEELHLVPFFTYSFLRGTVFPHMPKVRLLSLNFGEFYPSKRSFFPAGISIAETFPNLHTVIIHQNGFPDTGEYRRFPYLSEKEQVTTVERVFVRFKNSNWFRFKIQMGNQFPYAIVTYPENTI